MSDKKQTLTSSDPAGWYECHDVSPFRRVLWWDGQSLRLGPAHRGITVDLDPGAKPSEFFEYVRLVPVRDVGWQLNILAGHLAAMGYNEVTRKRVCQVVADLFTGCQPAASEAESMPAAIKAFRLKWGYGLRHFAETIGADLTRYAEFEGALKSVEPPPADSHPSSPQTCSAQDIEKKYGPIMQELREGKTGYELHAAWRDELADLLGCDKSVSGVRKAIIGLMEPKPPTVLIGNGKPLPAGVWALYGSDGRFANYAKTPPNTSTVGWLYLRISEQPPERIDPPAPPVVLPKPELKLFERGGVRQWFAQDADRWWRGLGPHDGDSYQPANMNGWREVAKGGGK